MFEFPSPGLAECWCSAHGFGCCVRNPALPTALQEKGPPEEIVLQR